MIDDADAVRALLAIAKLTPSPEEVDSLIAAYPLNRLEIDKMYEIPEARYEEPCVVFSAIP